MAADAQGNRWYHLQLYDVVQTPLGMGVIVQNWLSRVGIQIQSETIYLQDPEQIMQIRSSSYVPPGSEEWPYNDPEWTDEMLLSVGYLSRQALGYPPLS